MNEGGKQARSFIHLIRTFSPLSSPEPTLRNQRLGTKFRYFCTGIDVGALSFPLLSEQQQEEA